MSSSNDSARLEDAETQEGLYSNEQCGKYEPWQLITLGLLGVVMASVGVIVNSATIVALLRTKQRRDAFIINLGVSDLLYCVFVMPVIYSRHLGSNWVHVHWMCSLVLFLCYGNVGTSLMSVVLITIDRYVKIVHTAAYSTIFTTRNITAMILFNWIFSHIFLVPTLFQAWGKFEYDADICTCDLVKDEMGRSSMTAISILGFLLPCLAISLCYARIVAHLLLSERRVAQHNKAEDGNDRIAMWQTLKRTKMVFIIFAAFIACVLPILLIQNIDKKVEHPALHMFGYLLYNLNSCINPFIYAITTKRHRNAYVSLWQCVFKTRCRQQISFNVNTVDS